MKASRPTYLLDLMRELVGRDMKLRYKRSTLGAAWSLLNPLSQLVVLTFVFRLVLPVQIENFTTFLFTGLLAWTWFQTSLTAAAASVVDNRELIRQPGFPVAILPAVSIMSHMVHFILSLPVLALFLLFNEIPLTGALLALPLVIALQFLLTLGPAYFVATLHVSFRDIQYLLGILLLLGFYLSPVFYDVTHVPDRYQALYHLNPMVDLLSMYRGILLQGRLPNPRVLLTMYALASVVVVIGHRIYVRASYHFVEEL
ncbi:MAG: ABC transporter permease [Vicinamibacteria bacterium]